MLEDNKKAYELKSKNEKNSWEEKLKELENNESNLGSVVKNLNELVDSVESAVFNLGEKEVESKKIGEILMDKLQQLDPVAYVRFASVYREFKDVNTFMDEIKKLLEKQQKN